MTVCPIPGGEDVSQASALCSTPRGARWTNEAPKSYERALEVAPKHLPPSRGSRASPSD